MCCPSRSRNRRGSSGWTYEKRSAAAIKGWRTRRANMGQGFGIVPDPEPVYRPATMTFGGTIVAPTVADAKEVKTSVPA